MAMGAVALLLLVATWALTANVAAAFSSSSSEQQRSSPALPSNPDDIVKQAARAITRAYVEDGINRQTIKLPLSESMYGNKEESFVADRAIGWQGGPQETLRYLSPLVSLLLKEIKTTENTGGLVPKISEQLLLDFDGSMLVTSESPGGPLYDVQALLQPNTDDYYLRTIKAIEDSFSDTSGKPKRLFLLVNPAWRDKTSWGFFGGKKAQELILDRYSQTYVLDQFIVRGQQVSLLKCYPDDWGIYLADDARGTSVLVRTFKDRPEYKEMDLAIQAHVKSISKS